MRIQSRIMLAMTFLIALTAVTFSAITYRTQRDALIKGIDDKLVTAAMNIKARLPVDYHDLLPNEFAVLASRNNDTKTQAIETPEFQKNFASYETAFQEGSERFEEIVLRNNELCDELELQYLWSNLVVDKDHIYFTAATSPPGAEQRDKDSGHAKFFEEHTDPASFAAALQNSPSQRHARGEPSFSEFHNKWGHGKMVLIPFTDKHGRAYVFGASMSIEEVNLLVRRTLYSNLVLSGFVILAGVVISYSLANSLSKPIVKLTGVAESIADGELDHTIQVGRSSELVSLSTSINTMSKAIAEKITELHDEVERRKKAEETAIGKNEELSLEIAERKRVEKELRHLRNLLRNIVNSMPSVLVGVDAEGRVIQWNRLAQEATGVLPDEAHGRELADVFPQLAGEMEKVHQAIQRRETQKDMKVPTILEGRTRFSDVTVYPLITNGVEGAVIRVDDVTERVRIEEMMIQSEKMLSVGGLAAGMAHEINNPLAGILQSVQVVLERMSDPIPANETAARECGTSLEAIRAYSDRRKIGDMLLAIRDSGQRAAKIVDNMLSFSRKSSSGFAPENPCELLDQTIELAANDYDLKKKYDFRKIEIVRAYQPDLPKVPCEKTKIQQVILNLLKNGAQAMARDGTSTAEPQFVLRTALDGDMLRIDVQDNGPGMDEATRRRVFEPFFTTKDVGTGTGLGLSVSYFIIAENHGGTMEVESSPGQGADFVIRLPLRRSG